MDTEKSNVEQPAENTSINKKKDYVRYILAAILFALAAVFYVKDINKKKAEQLVQADLNYLHFLVSEENAVKSIDMIIDTENKSRINIMIPCSEEETKAITEALAKAEATDFLEEKREGKLFTIFLNCNNNARFCVEAAVIDEDPSNAYIRAKKPIKISDNEEKKEITWAYTAPAVIKGFGDYLNELYKAKLPEIERQSEFFQNALEKDENTKKLLDEKGDGKLILTPASKEQTEMITKQVEAIKAKKEAEAKAETPTTEVAPATEAAPATEEATPATEDAPATEEAPAVEETAGVVETTLDATSNIASSVADGVATTVNAVGDVAVTAVDAVGDVAKATVDTIGNAAAAVIDAVTPTKTEETK